MIIIWLFLLVKFEKIIFLSIEFEQIDIWYKEIDWNFFFHFIINANVKFENDILKRKKKKLWTSYLWFIEINMSVKTFAQKTLD